MNRTCGLTNRFDAKIENQQDIFDRRRTDSDTFYQPFGLILARPKWQADLPKTHKKQK